MLSSVLTTSKINRNLVQEVRIFCLKFESTLTKSIVKP
jgi:hypothetical protein